MKSLSQILGTIDESTTKTVEKPKFINFRGMKDKDLLLWLKDNSPTKNTSKEDKTLWVIGKKMSDKRGLKESKDIRTELLNTLSKIIENTDDVYNTLSLIGEDVESDDVRMLVKALYKQADTLYEKVDIDHGIIPAELNESLSWKLTVKNLFKLGFKEIENPSKAIYTTTKGRIQHLFGIPMRADKYADTFFVIIDSEKKPYGIADNIGTIWYENLGEALKELEDRSKLPKIDLGLEDSNDELAEVLNPNDEAGVWIHDFVHSKNPIFDGKSKKKRIEMALGAWYAAQKKEDVNEGVSFAFAIDDKSSQDGAKFDRIFLTLEKMLTKVEYNSLHNLFYTITADKLAAKTLLIGLISKYVGDVNVVDELNSIAKLAQIPGV